MYSFTPKSKKYFSILVFTFITILSIVAFLNHQKITKANGTIYVTSFTSSSYVLSATGVGHTYIFVVPDTINAASQNNFGITLTTNADVGVSGQASFCDATLDFLKDGGSTVAGVSLGANSEQDGVCTGVTLYLPDSPNIAAGSTMTASINNVINPIGEGNYYPDISDTTYSSSNTSSVPQQAFGTPLLKISVTQPDGSTPVSNANVWVHNAFYTKSGGAQTDIAGNTFFFAADFWLPEGISVGDTYVIEVEAPSDSDYTNAVGVTDISIVAGSTVDYSSSGDGPISLTRPAIKGTVVVPDGCTDCVAAAGDTIPYVSVDIRDAGFNPNNFTHANVDENGVFQIGGLSASTYLMEFMNPWDMTNYLGLMPPATIEFTVNSDGSVTYPVGTTTPASSLPVDLSDVEFRLAVKTISGTVTREDTGAPVVNVRIGAFKMMEPGMMNTTTDADGEYTILVGDGSWSIMPEIDFSNNFNDGEDNVTASWIYCGMPQSANFASTTAPETATNTDFSVKTTSATITGTVYDPDGVALTGGNAGVSIFSKDGCGVHTSIDPGDGDPSTPGVFTADVPPGTYNISIQMWDARYAAPATKTVIVSSGTVDAGDFNMTEYAASISGRLWADANSNGSYDSGEGVGNVRVEAFKVGKKFDEFAGPGSGGPGGPGPGMGGPMGGGDFASSNSSDDDATKGDFSIMVTQGTWIVNVMSDPGMMGGYSSTATNYLYTGSPTQVNIADEDGTSTGNNFELSIADATIQGRVVNAEDNEGIGGVYGYAFAEPSGSVGAGPMMGMGMGGPINNSAFTLKVPAGDYNIGVDFPPQISGYTPLDMTTVTAISGDTVTVDVPVTPNNATITINFKDSDGDLITNLSYAEVFMHNGAGGHQWHMLSSSDLSSGFTDILVGAGTWNIGYHINSSTDNYMSQPTSDNTVAAVANETVSTNITLRAADSTIAGTVYDPDGNTLTGVWISTDSRKTVGFNPMGGPMFMNGVMTDADGAYSLTMPAGTYQVAAFFPPSAIVGGETVAYLNPQAEEVTISPTSPATTNFTFAESDATITGNITLTDAAQGAYITAFSNDGGYNETTSTSGSYSLNVSSGTTWFVKAFYESGTSLYYSEIYEVDMSSATTATRNLILIEAPFVIPEPISTTFNCANAKKITLGNDAQISIPSSAIKPSSVQSCDSTDTGSNITITVSPTAQMSLQDKSIPIGIGYEISAKDGNGSVISDTFASNVTLSIPYSAEQITEAVGGVMDESLLGNGYWDTSTSSWRSISSQVIDTTANTLTISTNHFTLFGVLAAVDPATSDDDDDTPGDDDTSTTTSSSSVDPEAQVLTNRGIILEREQGNITLMIGQGALPYDADVDIYKMSEGFQKPTPPLWIGSGPYRLRLIARYNSQDFHTFNQPLTLILRYDPWEIGDIPPKSLRVNYYDTAKKRWYPLNSVLIPDRHQVATVLDKVHGIYALIGGFGYQGAPYSVDNTVTAVSSSQDLGIDDSIMPPPQQTPTSKDTIPTQENVAPPSASTDSVPAPTPKPNLFTRIINFVKSIFSK